jgi:hypothetical protein
VKQEPASTKKKKRPVAKAPAYDRLECNRVKGYAQVKKEDSDCDKAEQS